MTELDPDLVSTLLNGLRERCKRENRPITRDDCVGQVDAAALLDRSPRTLERWRTDARMSGKARLPWRRGNGHCLRYALHDIAVFMTTPEV